MAGRLERHLRDEIKIGSHGVCHCHVVELPRAETLECGVIVVIDYGMGNLGSVMNMFERIGVAAVRSSKPEEIAKASKLVLPGVGAFDHGMEQIRNLNLESVLHEKVLAERAPFLGICLGMQLMANSSEEGTATGLGWIDAKVVRFDLQPDKEGRAPKVPHMGWGYVRLANGRAHRVFNKIGNDTRYYFVHSYHVVCSNPNDSLLQTNYGGTDFTSAVARGNLIGVQFHPEKSHRYGISLFQEFAAWTPARQPMAM